VQARYYTITGEEFNMTEETKKNYFDCHYLPPTHNSSLLLGKKSSALTELYKHINHGFLGPFGLS
jgi:hypothetical protein